MFLYLICLGNKPFDVLIPSRTDRRRSDTNIKTKCTLWLAVINMNEFINCKNMITNLNFMKNNKYKAQKQLQSKNKG